LFVGYQRNISIEDCQMCKSFLTSGLIITLIVGAVAPALAQSKTQPKPNTSPAPFFLLLIKSASICTALDNGEGKNKPNPDTVVCEYEQFFQRGENTYGVQSISVQTKVGRMPAAQVYDCNGGLVVETTLMYDPSKPPPKEKIVFRVNGNIVDNCPDRKL
jgi:hypothetical protein